MEIKDVIRLFKKACDINDWGSQSYIHILDDGSGEVVSEDNVYDGELLFEFENEDELIEKLEKSIK